MEGLGAAAVTDGVSNKTEDVQGTSRAGIVPQLAVKTQALCGACSGLPEVAGSSGDAAGPPEDVSARSSR